MRKAIRSANTRASSTRTWPFPFANTKREVMPCLLSLHENSGIISPKIPASALQMRSAVLFLEWPVSHCNEKESAIFRRKYVLFIQTYCRESVGGRAGSLLVGLRIFRFAGEGAQGP